MKNTKRPLLALLLAASIMNIALTAFTTHGKPYREPLKVERQEWVLQHMVGFIPCNDYDIGIVVDVPVVGDPVLVDSVTRLLNQALYYFMDNGMEHYFTPEAVYCADPKHLLQQYREAYKPFIADTCYQLEEPSCFPHFFHHLSVTLEEQTNTFVSYKVSEYFVGEGDFEYSDWVTFDKTDGHRLREVISDDDIMRFYEEHPEYRPAGPWEDMEYLISMGYSVKGRNTFGLKNDKVWNEYLYAPGIIDTTWFDMELIRPYLSEEARKLLE